MWDADVGTKDDLIGRGIMKTKQGNGKGGGGIWLGERKWHEQVRLVDGNGKEKATVELDVVVVVAVGEMSESREKGEEQGKEKKTEGPESKHVDGEQEDEGSIEMKEADEGSFVCTLFAYFVNHFMYVCMDGMNGWMDVSSYSFFTHTLCDYAQIKQGINRSASYMCSTGRCTKGRTSGATRTLCSD
jgi:hypothetical protein